MRFLLAHLLLVLALVVAAPVAADARPDHYQGKSPESLEQALAYFSEYNQRLSLVLAKDELDLVDLNTIHQLTYTLENALERMREDLARLADTLEALHLASETADREGVRNHGRAFLEGARPIGR